MKGKRLFSIPLPQLILLLIVVFTVACNNQQENLKNTTTRQKVIRLLQEADTLQKNDPNLQQQHVLVQRSLKIARRIQDDSLISEAHLKLGNYYLMQLNDSARVHFLNARKGFRRLRLQDRIVRSDAALVTFYSKKAEFGKASPYIIDAELRIGESPKPNEDHIYYYLQKTIFYHSLGLSDSAMLTVNKGEELCKRIQNNKYLPNLMASRAVVYSVLGDFRKSLQDQKKIVREFSPYSTDRAIVYTNIGNNYARLHLPDSAELYYRKAVSIYTKIAIGGAIMSKFHTTAASSLLESNKDACRNHFKQINPNELTLPNQFYYRYIKANLETNPALRKAGLEQAISFADSTALPMNDLKKDCYYELHELAAASGEFAAALRYYQQFTELNDKVRGEEITAKLEQLSFVNHIREKESTIKNQKEVIDQKSQTISQQRLNTWLIISLSVILVIVFILFLLNYRKKVRISNLLLDQTQLERELLLNAVSPVSGQLEQASELLKTVKKELLNEATNKQQNMRSAIDQWLISYSDQTSLVDVSKEHERAFLTKLDNYPELSETEKRVVILIRQGYQSKEIAARLNLALNTIEIYRSKIRKKMQAPANEQLNSFIKHL